ncbi:MAG: permease [Halobacteria archaeon]
MVSTTALFINVFVLICFIASLLKDREKSGMGLKAALKTFIRILPSFLIVLLFIGLVLGFVSQEVISQFLGEKAGIAGVLTAATLGAILYIPALFAFPLAASLLDAGASVSVIAAFITTLTMVGIITLPLEIRELGKSFALLRNSLSFIAALIIGIIMGVIL